MCKTLVKNNFANFRAWASFAAPCAFSTSIKFRQSSTDIHLLFLNISNRKWPKINLKFNNNQVRPEACPESIMQISPVEKK